MSVATARVIDPVGVKHTYRGTAPTLAGAIAELKAVLKLVQGTVQQVTTTDAEQDPAVVAAVGAFHALSAWADCTLVMKKVVATGVEARNIRMQDVTAAVNVNGHPDITNGLFAGFNGDFTDSDGNGGYTLTSAKWETKFSGTQG